jgi:hypothetical protein
LFCVLEFWDVVFYVRNTISINGEECPSKENFYGLIKLMNLCYVMSFDVGIRSFKIVYRGQIQRCDEKP